MCALHVRTAGLGGAALGSDEEEIVYLAYVVIDVLTNQVSQQYNTNHLRKQLIRIFKLRMNEVRCQFIESDRSITDRGAVGVIRETACCRSPRKDRLPVISLSELNVNG